MTFGWHGHPARPCCRLGWRDNRLVPLPARLVRLARSLSSIAGCRSRGALAAVSGTARQHHQSSAGTRSDDYLPPPPHDCPGSAVARRSPPPIRPEDQPSSYIRRRARVKRRTNSPPKVNTRAAALTPPARGADLAVKARCTAAGGQLDAIVHGERTERSDLPGQRRGRSAFTVPSVQGDRGVGALGGVGSRTSASGGRHADEAVYR